MKKALWLSYDLGVKGDYPSLYAWLDNHEAVECGDSVAFLNYNFLSSDNIPEKIKSQLEESVSFNKSDRVYLIWRNEDGSVKGRYIIGKRKASPWQGYGNSEVKDDV